MVRPVAGEAGGPTVRGATGLRTAPLIIRAFVVLTCMGIGLARGVTFAGSPLPRLFHIEAGRSHVWFDADAPLHSFRGETREMSGSFTLQHTAPLQISDATVTIKAASIETGNGARDADMRQDFLEVERFPTIELRIVELLTTRPMADGTSWDVVLGVQLTVHGTTRNVPVPATVRLAAEGLTARGQVSLDMRDFRIRVPRILLIPMSSEVRVGFDVVARPAE